MPNGGVTSQFGQLKNAENANMVLVEGNFPGVGLSPLIQGQR